MNPATYEVEEVVMVRKKSWDKHHELDDEGISEELSVALHGLDIYESSECMCDCGSDHDEKEAEVSWDD